MFVYFCVQKDLIDGMIPNELKSLVLLHQKGDLTPKIPCTFLTKIKNVNLGK
jgi:hypothetical protein